MSNTILHLSADFPDTRRGQTTLAVKNFVSANPSFDHVIVSMKRRSNPLRCYFAEEPAGPGIRIFPYGNWGLRFGIAHFASMFLAARRIHRMVKAEDIRPVLIHAHRMTFEGIAAWLLARWLGTDFAVSARGEVEVKILRYKPTYRGLIKRILRDAHRIYFVSLWFRDEALALEPSIAGKSRALPNFCESPSVVPSHQPPAHPHFVTIMNLAIYRKKGFHWLVDAFARFSRDHPDAQLDVIGALPETLKSRIEGIVNRAGVRERVNFLGAIEHARVLKRLSDYTALVLPSVNETFGMAYVEALLAGVPILYTWRSGIDGYVDDLDAGVGVSAGSVAEIAAGLARLFSDGQRYRAALREKHIAIRDRFSPDQYVAAYKDDILALRTNDRASPVRGASRVASHSRL